MQEQRYKFQDNDPNVQEPFELKDIYLPILKQENQLMKTD